MGATRLPHLHKRGLIAVIALVIAAAMALAYDTFATPWEWNHSANQVVRCDWYGKYGDYRDQQNRVERINGANQKRIKGICKSHRWSGAVAKRSNGNWNKYIPMKEYCKQARC